MRDIEDVDRDWDFRPFNLTIARMRSSFWWSTVPPTSPLRGEVRGPTGRRDCNRCHGEVG